MATYTLGLVVPDLAIPQMWPCSALTAPNTSCGATPASKYLRSCGVVDHIAEVWLCPVHATLAVAGGAICRLCALRGGVVPVMLMRLSEPIRIGGIDDKQYRRPL